MKVNTGSFIHIYNNTETQSTMQIADELIHFKLHGTDGEIHSSHIHDDKKALVVIFTCNHCPYARAYVSRIARLVDKFEPQGVGFFAISANDVVQYPSDSLENMHEVGKLMHMNGNYLYDESQEVAHSFGAQRTPEVFIFDINKKLAYHGAIDNNWEDADKATEHYVANALSFLLQGKEPAVKETPAVGCSIKWKPAL